MPDVLSTQCVGRVVKVDSSCGCTLTRASITGLTPADIVALSYKEIYLTKAILDAREAGMLGVPERSLQTLLNSSIKNVKEKLSIQKIDDQSIIMPFIQRTQRQFVNANYWTIASGTPSPLAGTTGYPASSFVIKLALGNSPFQTTLGAIERYFLPGSTLIVKNWDNWVTKTAQTISFTIISAVNADSGGKSYANVTVYAPVSDANWALYTALQKALYKPTFGMAETGSNSISEYESYCQNQPSELARNIIVNWLQTSRESYCREQSYEETLDQILKGKVNDYLKGFKYVSIAEQQKQQRARFELEQMNSAFFGNAIDVDNQTTSNWQNLPVVYDLVNTTCPLAYKASSLGIFTLLSNCNRVIDMQGNTLLLDDIFSRIYYLRRFREASGDRVPIIDSMTDRYTAGSIYETMSKYYKARYGVETTRFAKIGEQIKFENFVMFTYDIYDVKEAGCQWAVFTDDYFNDLVDAYSTTVVGWNFQTRGNNLWFIDWSDVSKGVAGTKQAQRKYPEVDPVTLAAYKCVITPNPTTYDLRQTTWTMMVDRPERHLIYHNFRAGCPRVTIPGCTVPQS